MSAREILTALTSRIQRNPVSSYFVLAYGMSWLGAFAVAAPHWMKGEALPKMSGLMTFPVMLLGPSIAGMVMTGTTRGKDGLRDLLARMSRTGSRLWSEPMYSAFGGVSDSGP